MLQNVLTAAAAVFPVAKCRLLPALSFIDCLPMPCSPLSLSLLPTPSFAFRLHHTPFAIGQPFGSCQIVSCGCHTLRISNAPYAALPLLAARCSVSLSLSARPCCCWVFCVKCQCLCLCVCVSVCVSVFSITKCQTC